LATIANEDTKWLYLVAGFFLGTMEAGFLVSFFNITGKDYPADIQVAVNCGNALRKTKIFKKISSF
jgi:hypothetical protein